MTFSVGLIASFLLIRRRRINTALSPTSTSSAAPPKAPAIAKISLDDNAIEESADFTVGLKATTTAEISVAIATFDVESAAGAVIGKVVASPVPEPTVVETVVEMVEATVLLVTVIGKTHVERCCIKLVFSEKEA